MPRNILAGMIKKQEAREEKASKLARDAGIVTAKPKSGKKKVRYSEESRRMSRLNGPAPSIGYSFKGQVKVDINK